MEATQKKALTVPIRLVTILLLYSLLFQYMQWPYGLDLMLIGSLLLAFMYGIRFALKRKKLNLDYVKLSIVAVWTLRIVTLVFIGSTFINVFNVVLIGLGIWWFFEEGIDFYSNRKLKLNGTLKVIYYILIALSVLMCVVGILLRILHWPYGALIFTLGVLSVSLFMIIDLFVVKRT